MLVSAQNLPESSLFLHDNEIQKQSNSSAAQPVAVGQSGNELNPAAQTTTNQGSGNQENSIQGVVISPNGGTGSTKGGTGFR